MKKSILFIFVTSVLFGCGVKESEHLKVVAQRDSLQLIVTSLTERVDQLENGEDRLMNFINLHNENKDYIKAHKYIESLKKYHPESQLIKTHSKLFANIEHQAKIEQDRIDKAIQDSIKLANIDKLGIWKVGNWVDDFDEPTGKHFVYTNLYGKFSNSATAGSKLRVYIRISENEYSKKKNDYDVELFYDEYDNGTYEDERYEYTKVVNKAAKKVYRAYSRPTYGLEDDNGKKYSLEEVLLNEGYYEFDIEFEYSTRYNFEVNTKYLNNALVKAGLKSIDEI